MALQERLLREARNQCQLQHPAIVRAYGTFQSEGRTFILMELVNGESLETYLTLRFTLPGNSNVTAVEAQARIATSVNVVTFNGTISNDNTSWTSSQTYVTNSSYISFIETNRTYSTLNWTNPAYCYVRLIPTHSGNGDGAFISALSIVVNP